MAPFNYDDNGIEKRPAYVPMPEGDYVVKVLKAEPGVTKNGDDKVTVAYEVMEGQFKGRLIKNHTVTFFKDRKKKGAGMALDVLKALGEPWEGAFTVNERNWVDRYVLAHIIQEAFEVTDEKTGAKKTLMGNKVRWLNEYKAPEHDPFMKKEEESVPF